MGLWGTHIGPEPQLLLLTSNLSLSEISSLSCNNTALQTWLETSAFRQPHADQTRVECRLLFFYFVVNVAITQHQGRRGGLPTSGNNIIHYSDVHVGRSDLTVDLIF